MKPKMIDLKILEPVVLRVTDFAKFIKCKCMLPNEVCISCLWTPECAGYQEGKWQLNVSRQGKEFEMDALSTDEVNQILANLEDTIATKKIL